MNRFFDNMLFPVRFVNNLLQLKLINAGEETLRFTINSSIGLLGFFDPAKSWFGLEEHEEDFGQTLGYYGVGGGFHIVLPFLGPSNLRDTFSMYPDKQMEPLHQESIPQRAFNRNVPRGLAYHPDFYRELGVEVVEVVNETSLHIGEYQSLKKDALDWYLFLRDFYEQNRIKKISE